MAALAPLATLAGKDRSSSAGIVLARPTKQWVLPERAKPGRKPKKAVVGAVSKKAEAKTEDDKGAVAQQIDAGTPASAHSPESPDPAPASAPTDTATAPTPSSSTLTNRDAQRQFRLRKSSYVASLEARVAAYERGELSRSVEIQARAVAVREENEGLKRRLRVMEKEVERWRVEAMRGRAMLREVLSGGSGAAAGLVRMRAGAGSGQSPAGKSGMERSGVEDVRRQRVGADGPVTPPVDALEAPSARNTAPDRRSSVHSPLAGPSRLDPAPPAPFVMPTPAPSNTGIDRRPSRPAPIDTGSFLSDPDPVPAPSLLACGFCTDLESACVCRMVAEADGKLEIQTPIAETAAATATFGSGTTSSLLVNLPAPEAAVPLPRRNRKRQLSNAADRPAQTWWVQPATAHTDTAGVVAVKEEPRRFSMSGLLARCSGDPSDCDACRNDDFGRAFCERLTSTICASSSGGRCAHCTPTTRQTPPDIPLSLVAPSPQTTTSTPRSSDLLAVPCCGNGAICGSHPRECFVGGSAGGNTSVKLPSIADALEQAGAGDDLDGLRDDDGRELMIGADDAWRALKAHPNASFGSLDMLADVVARRSKCVGPRVELSPPPFVPEGDRQLVPLDELVTHRSKRKLEVQSSAVREALAILDAEPAKRQRTE